MRRVGHDVEPFDTSQFQEAGGTFARRVRSRTVLGGAVSRCNGNLLEFVRSHQFDIAWFDKALFIWSDTVDAIRATGALTIHYNPDNPFGPRRDPGWRVFRRALSHYDVHVVPRECNIADYTRAGARRVMTMQFAYEPTMHFSPPRTWSDKDRLYHVSFVGSPHDQRRQFLIDLWRRHGIRVHVRGPRWNRVLSAKNKKILGGEGPVWSDDYRMEIWRSRILLSFVTHSNLDTVAHRSFEIAACGGFLLAERTADHAAAFREGEEAVFFSTVDECAALIQRYLPDEAARQRIGTAGRQRAVSSGYSNDDTLRRLLDML